MYCCIRCFDPIYHMVDGVNIKWIFESATCSFCRSSTEHPIEPAKLREPFRQLALQYDANETGIPFTECLIRDWGLFERSIDAETAYRLMDAITGNPEISRRRYVPAMLKGLDFLADWPRLRAELIQTHRYFPSGAFNRPRVSAVLERAQTMSDELQSPWYRARIQSSSSRLDAHDMGPPPKHLASSGRANPSGIPYLYLASTAEAAVAEVRPHTAECVSVAPFVLASGIKITDFRYPKYLVARDMWLEREQAIKSREVARFFQLLSDELANPVARYAAGSDYAPSQYVCEFVKTAGFGGLLYRSAVSGADNLVLFDASTATVGEVASVRVDQVQIETIRNEDDHVEVENPIADGGTVLNQSQHDACLRDDLHDEANGDKGYPPIRPFRSPDAEERHASWS